MSFTVTRLYEGHLVEGTDSKGREGQVVLHSPSWDAYLQYKLQKEASEEFDLVTTEFFKPLVETAEAIKARLADPTKKWKTIVINEGDEGTDAEGIELDYEGVRLRILAETDGSALRWVNDQLVAVLA